MRLIPLSAISPRRFEKNLLGGCRFYRGRGFIASVIIHFKELIIHFYTTNALTVLSKV
jgi:hypothetical protein